jgi:glycosyltransferase involved in cell wall biosynthesis
MTDSRAELDILILGPVPPPLGGVAVHVSRLVPLLQSAGLTVGVLNHFDSVEASFVLGSLKRNPLNYYRLPGRFPARLLHYHHSRWSTLMAVALARHGRTPRYVLTIHSGELGDQLNSTAPLIGRVTRWALRRFDAIVVVNSTLRSVILEHLADQPIEVLPAFLEAREEERVYDTFTETFLSSGETLIVPVYRIKFLKDGSDVYGLDTAVDAFILLARERRDLQLAFFIAQSPSGGKARQHLEGLLERLGEAGLKERVMVVFGLPLVPAFRHDVVVLRPTRTEGDALSVREALHAGKPVVASDAVERPQGAVTFAAGQVVELCTAVRKALDESQSGLPRPRDTAKDDTSDRLLNSLIALYRRELQHASVVRSEG